MANTFFKFKQFTIEQDIAAMKVCTDSCLFAAWVAEQFKNIPVHKTLDIGSGTGLLSLMLAQNIAGEIHAIEINADALNQTKNNFISSPWKERLKIYHDDIRSFKNDNLYDLIICNPPFYQKSLLSLHNHINQARHDASLQPHDLIKCVRSFIKTNGNFAVLLPYHLTDQFITMADENNLYVNKLVTVSNFVNSKPIRTMLIFSAAKTDILKSSLAIKNGEEYSEQFKSLLKDYYLSL